MMSNYAEPPNNTSLEIQNTTSKLSKRKWSQEHRTNISKEMETFSVPNRQNYRQSLKATENKNENFSNYILKKEMLGNTRIVKILPLKINQDPPPNFKNASRPEDMHQLWMDDEDFRDFSDVYRRASMKESKRGTFSQLENILRMNKPIKKRKRTSLFDIASDDMEEMNEISTDSGSKVRHSTFSQKREVSTDRKRTTFIQDTITKQITRPSIKLETNKEFRRRIERRSTKLENIQSRKPTVSEVLPIRSSVAQRKSTKSQKEVQEIFFRSHILHKKPRIRTDQIRSSQVISKRTNMHIMDFNRISLLLQNDDDSVRYMNERIETIPQTSKPSKEKAEVRGVPNEIIITKPEDEIMEKIDETGVNEMLVKKSISSSKMLTDLASRPIITPKSSQLDLNEEYQHTEFGPDSQPDNDEDIYTSYSDVQDIVRSVTFLKTVDSTSYEIIDEKPMAPEKKSIQIVSFDSNISKEMTENYSIDLAASEGSISSDDSSESGESGKFHYKFNGSEDENYLRYRFGCLKWKKVYDSRKYCGDFLFNSLHGGGCYFIKMEDHFNFYSGQFYSNKLHGYGQIVYNNGNVFEGLFKDNSRFGPGVYSYRDGTEDVGIWNGNSIFRLSSSLSDNIPQIAKSNVGKIRLFQFKKIIPLMKDMTDHAEGIMKTQNAEDKLLKMHKCLYNPHVRQNKSLFFNVPSHEKAFFGEVDNLIEITKNYNVIKTDSDVILPGEQEYCENSDLQDYMNYELNKIKKKLKEIRKQTEKINNWHDCSHEMEIQEDKSRENIYLTELETLKGKEAFYVSVLNYLSYKIKRNFDSTISRGDGDPEKISVNSILSWNNDIIIQEILKYSFQCRKSESNVTFHVKSLMIGDRKKFGEPGEHERNCETFLQECQDIETDRLLELIVNGQVNPNVSDSKGNTGLHMASRADNVNAIRVLANNGANLDCTNDEGLTPLSLGLLRYLAEVYRVFSWERAFLTSQELSLIEQENLTKWRPHESFFELLHSNLSFHQEERRSSRSSTVSTGSKVYDKTYRGLVKRMGMPIASKSFSSAHLLTKDNYIFSLEYVPNKPHTESETKIRENISRKSRIKYSLRQEQTEVDPNILHRIMTTIQTLIHYGANINLDGVPQSPFFMSLFTKSSTILEYFLEHGANPNHNFQGRTPLHLISCMKPCSENIPCLRILLKYLADPDILSDPSIWIEADKDLIGAAEVNCEIVPRGKSALQLMCLRGDVTNLTSPFLCQMIEVLIEANARTKSLYLGHSLLSIAILKGNIHLVECLLRFIDPNRPLGFNLGNALTVLCLTRYPNIIPFNICRDVEELLFNHGMTVFDSIYNHYNIFEFLDADSPPNYGDTQRNWDKYIQQYATRRAILNKKNITYGKHDNNLLLKTYIQERSRNTLAIIHNLKAIFYLYCFIREGSQPQPLEQLAKFTGSSAEAEDQLQFIFQSGWMPKSYFSIECVSKLLKMIDEVNDTPKKVEVSSEETYATGKKPKEKFRTFRVEDYSVSIDVLKFEESREPQPEGFARVINDWILSRSDLCYFCMQRTGKVLLRCPSCGIVKFCSQRCNYISHKIAKQHPCNNLFYDEVYKEYREFIIHQLPIPLYGIDLHFEIISKTKEEFMNLPHIHFEDTVSVGSKNQSIFSKNSSHQTEVSRMRGGRDSSTSYSHSQKFPGFPVKIKNQKIAGSFASTNNEKSSRIRQVMKENEPNGSFSNVFLHVFPIGGNILSRSFSYKYLRTFEANGVEYFHSSEPIGLDYYEGILKNPSFQKLPSLMKAKDKSCSRMDYFGESKIFHSKTHGRSKLKHQIKQMEQKPPKKEDTDRLNQLVKSCRSKNMIVVDVKHFENILRQTFDISKLFLPYACCNKIEVFIPCSDSTEYFYRAFKII